MMRENMNIVVIGHVDHGKSTVIGRLFADTGSLPEGKLESVKEYCRRHSRPFEYAYLLDALKDEQSQGITIDTARSFFKTEKRDYIIIDAPGHLEFLKNMISGAARAEAALLVIDALEGIRENSRRHGYLASLLGIRELCVAVNKMDLVGYDEKIFFRIKKDFMEYSDQIGVKPVNFIPVSARHGDNLITASENTPWYRGASVLKQLDEFKKEKSRADKDLRFPVQDVYKFTEAGDDRRIAAGLIESGEVKINDEIIFFPSGNKSTVKSIEMFNAGRVEKISAGFAPGFTFKTQIYIKPGEIMCRAGDAYPKVGRTFKANIFWMSKAAMVKNKNYKLKIAADRCAVKLIDVINVIDSTDLSSGKKGTVERYNTAECILETAKPVAFDLYSEHVATGRFVIVDEYEIAGGGIICACIDHEPGAFEKEEPLWDKGFVTGKERALLLNCRAVFILFCANGTASPEEYAKNLEKNLFEKKTPAYYLSDLNLLNANSESETVRAAGIEKILELGKIITDSGQIFITAVKGATDAELEFLKKSSLPHKLIVINIGRGNFEKNSTDINIAEEEKMNAAISFVVEELFDRKIIF
jgi:bifunctional enzyme CysN/CysC